MYPRAIFRCTCTCSYLVDREMCACTSYKTVLSTRLHPADPVSAPILRPREMQALWSQNHDKEVLQLQCSEPSRQCNGNGLLRLLPSPCPICCCQRGIGPLRRVCHLLIVPVEWNTFSTAVMDYVISDVLNGSVTYSVD